MKVFFCGDPDAEQKLRQNIHPLSCTSSLTEDQSQKQDEGEIGPSEISDVKKSQNPVHISVKESSSLPKHKRIRFVKGTRIALTQSQCASPTGEELIALLREILNEGVHTDGLITEDGIRRLNLWLEKNIDTDITAIKFLLQASDRILRKGKVTTAKAFEMHFAIERVLPANLREEFKRVRQDAWLHSPLKPKATPAQLEYIRNLGGDPMPGLNTAEASLLIEALLEHSTPASEQSATEKQINFIRELGGNSTPGLSKAAASDLIAQLLDKKRELLAKQDPPTPRQIMILRFWNRLDLLESSKRDVEIWLTQFYEEDPRRKKAWEHYKMDFGDDGSQCDPSFVPLGIGKDYLEII